MEDLVPLIFFLVIVLVNGFKFFIEKAQRKRGQEQPREERPKRQPSSIEEFFENLAEQVAPRPTPVADWPENRGRPDYVKEMEAFESAQAEEWAVEEEPEPDEIFSYSEPVLNPDPIAAPETSPSIGNSTHSRSQFQTSSAILSGSREIRVPGLGPFPRINASSRIEFSLKGKKNLRQAMIANIVLGPPRACDCSFDNTIAK